MVELFYEKNMEHGFTLWFKTKNDNSWATAKNGEYGVMPLGNRIQLATKQSLSVDLAQYIAGNRRRRLNIVRRLCVYDKSITGDTFYEPWRSGKFHNECIS